ncbi:unnamed protein product [Gongylonema pulchrum]|uniref:Protein kinase domain-containing protein n=1 Tax=Gongylonema pulchrum TaxID=637853 RepID=A0A183E5D4_9BILA|nr:unnamed protein product [Gongylonema pulchrum]
MVAVATFSLIQELIVAAVDGKVAAMPLSEPWIEEPGAGMTGLEGIKDEAPSSPSLSTPPKDGAAQREATIPLMMPGVAARLTTNTAADVRSLKFRRHKLAGGTAGYVYTVANSGASNERVVRLGREERSEEEGCDYALAFVNRRTGHVEYLPTKLICFENVAAAEFDEILDNSRRPKIDYSAHNAATNESWADKRRALTDQFGSAKKMKVLDAAKRRHIKDETLSVMMNSAFSSTAIKKEDENVEEKTDISMLTTVGT